METKQVDLVIQGGGVKGIAALGAILPLYDAGYRFSPGRGTSAGAIVAALVAAYQRAGEDLHKLEVLMRQMEYAAFKRDSLLERVAGNVGRGVELLLHDGMYSGDYLYEWLGPLLEAVGVTTFGDLRLDDPGSSTLDYQFLLAGGRGHGHLPAGAGAVALGLRQVRPAGRPAEDRRRGAGVDVLPVLPSRSRCSTAPTTGRSAGPPGAFGSAPRHRSWTSRSPARSGRPWASSTR